MDNDILKVLLTEADIKNICEELGKKITEDYKDKNLLVVAVLRGSVVFLSDIIRRIKCPCQIDFMAVSSYSGTKSSGGVQFKKDLDTNPEGFDVLIIEDILDTGLTLKFLIDVLKTKKANSVKICTLLDKPENRKADIKADYVGASVPNEFVVGYGLDYNEKYRNLPYLGVLKPEIYRN